jgi:hypothetical protein
LCFTDIDDDGHQDMVSAVEDRIVWYRNSDGHGQLEDARPVWIGYQPESLRAADADADGDSDIGFYFVVAKAVTGAQKTLEIIKS